MHNNSWDNSYIKLLWELEQNGYDHFDNSRNINTKAKFGYQITHDLSQGFPLLTTKKMAWKAIIGELLWFLRGDTDIKYLLDNNINIWNKDAYSFFCKRDKELFHKFRDQLGITRDYTPMLTYEEFIDRIKNNNISGDLGPVYGAQWRRWETGSNIPTGYNKMSNGGHVTYAPEVIDQVQNIINSITNNPNDRGHIISAWNVNELKNMALRPCHILTQFNVRGEYLDTLFYMRSNDVFLGLPFNMASYALLTHIIALITNKKPGNLTYMAGNVHLYENHIDAAKEQMERITESFPLPNLIISDKAKEVIINKNNKGFDFIVKNLNIEDFKLDNYQSLGALKAEMTPKIN